jgi:hypothetical protein
MMSVASQKRRPSMLISVEGTGKNELKPDQEAMGDTSTLSH